ncbi:MAG: pitrilysin family protein [Nanoarchaeota archaeon]|nr:pitrilysin family protein [Nanoarchaeota archaeon]
MELKISETKTKIGVPLWTLSSSNYNSVVAGVIIKCGTRDEIWPKEAGIAHALEHMHFQGTKNFPNSMILGEYIEETGGKMNAFTNNERTFYFARVPIEYAERGVRFLSEQIEKSIFPEDKIPIEMKNIIQEIKRRNDDPHGLLWKTSQQFIYGNHPLSRDILGIEESVLAFTKNDFLEFKKRNYNSSNYVFVVVGNITEDEALKLFNKYFDNKPGRNPNKRENIKVIPPQEKQFIRKKELDQLHISFDALIGKGSDKSSLYLEFFRDMISGGMSFPLFQEVRDKRGLCYSIGASLTKRTDVGDFNIYIGTDPKRHKEAISATLEVIEKSKSDEVLLNKVKNLKLGQLALEYENTQDVIYSVTNDILFFGRPRGFEEIKKEIEEVAIGNIEESVNKYLNPDSIFTTMLAPKDFTVD